MKIDKCCICNRCLIEVGGYVFKNKHNGKYMCSECAKANGVLDHNRKTGKLEEVDNILRKSKN